MIRSIHAVDLFCGVGGLTHGLEHSGINVKLGVDIDDACEYPITRNTSAEFLNADISTIDANTISDYIGNGDVSLLAGCAPCQPFSTYARGAKRNGKIRKGRGGSDDWKLIEKFSSLVRDLNPDLVAMENVPPLLHQDVFRKFVESLEGYSVDFKVVECSTTGLPQTRKRLVILASKIGQIKIPIFRSSESTVRSTIYDLPRLGAGETDPHDRLHRSSRLSKLNLERIRASSPGGSWRDWPESLRASCHKKESGSTYPSVYGRMSWDSLAPTITTQCFGYGNGRFGHPSQDRAISLREAAMLQGFPRSYAFLSDDENISFSKLGRLIGNAVPVTLGRAIGNIIVDHVSNASLAAA